MGFTLKHIATKSNFVSNTGKQDPYSHADTNQNPEKTVYEHNNSLCVHGPVGQDLRISAGNHRRTKAQEPLRRGAHISSVGV